MVIGREGFPIAHEVFDGNVQDRKTLGRMLDLLKERVGLPEGSTVVVDRGMAYAENIAEIRQRKHHYVIAARQPERDQWLDEFEDAEGFELVPREPSPLNPARRNRSSASNRSATTMRRSCFAPARSGSRKTGLFVTSKRVASWPIWTVFRTRIEKGRLKREIAIGEAIGRLKERYPRVARYHTISYDPTTRKLEHEPNAEKKAKADCSMGVTCCGPIAPIFQPARPG